MESNADTAAIRDLHNILESAPEIVISQRALEVAAELSAQSGRYKEDLQVGSMLAWFCLERARVFGADADTGDFPAALELFGAILPTTPQLVPVELRPYLSSEQAEARTVQGLQSKFERRHGSAMRTGHPILLDIVVDLAGQLSDAYADESSDEARRRYLLGIALSRRWTQSNESTAGLDQSIAILREVVDAPELPRSDVAPALSTLCVSLRERFERTGEQNDLDDAIVVGRRAVHAVESQRVNDVAASSNLGVALMRRYELSGDDLDYLEGRRNLELALSVAEALSTRGKAVARNLVILLRVRAERNNDVQAINHAIEIDEDGVRAAGDDRAAGAPHLGSLSYSLRLRFMRTGDPHDLDRAIECGQAALDVAEHQNSAAAVLNFGASLITRYELHGQTADLDLAISVYDRAVERSELSRQQRARLMNNLASALMQRFEQTGNLEDVDQGIAACEQAVSLSLEHEQARYMYFSSLSNVLQLRNREHPEPAFLERAVDAAVEALGAGGTVGWVAGARFTTLAGALRLRFRHLGDRRDLERAIEANMLAVRAVSDDDLEHGRYSFNLAGALHERAVLDNSAADLDQALQAALEAASTLGAPVSIRITAARRRAEWAAEAALWHIAAETYEQAVGLLSLLAFRGLERTDRESRLSTIAGLASDAAACLLTTGDALRAVQVLEQGRGILFGQALDLRAEVDALQTYSPDLAEKLYRIRAVLNDSDVPSAAWNIADAEAPRPQVASFARRRQAATDFDALLNEIRALPGFDDFLGTPDAAVLYDAAKRGPIVVINVSQWRSDAIVVLSQGIEVVPLRLTREDVSAQARYFARAVGDAMVIDSLEVRADAENELFDVLEWLWYQIAEPVLRELRLKPSVETSTLTNITWCPTGALALLPLHAAGTYRVAFKDNPSAVTDSAISAYTPTIRALLHSRQEHGGERDGVNEMLVVSMPETPGLPALPAAESEARLLLSEFAGRVRVLSGQSALRADVLNELRRSSSVHFACHAWPNLAAPSESLLVLWDYSEHPFRVADLLQLQLDNRELAFLSACSTGRTAVGLPDEFLHLAGAFQLSGFRHVIATLWPVRDQEALFLVREFYQAMQKADVALSLHQAIKALRAIQPDHPSAWAAHIYSGA